MSDEQLKHWSFMNHLYDMLNHGQFEKANRELVALEESPRGTELESKLESVKAAAADMADALENVDGDHADWFLKQVAEALVKYRATL